MLFYIASIGFIIPAPASYGKLYTSTCNTARRKPKSEQREVAIW